VAVFPSVYRAKAVHIKDGLIDTFVPQVFGETSIKISEYLGGPPEAPGMGWVVFQGGNPEFPVWAGNLASGASGGGTGGGTNEVWISPDEPLDPAVELWYDSDEPAPYDALSLAAHLTDANDAHDASAISLIPVGTISSTNVQDAIAEIITEEATRVVDHGSLTGLLDDDHPQYAHATDLAAHLSDTVDAHDASAISFVPTGTIAANDVQSAIAEVAAEAVPQVQPINTQTGTTYTFVLTDIGKLVTFNNAASIAVTVPPASSVAFPAGIRIDCAQLGAGQVTFVQGVGVNIRVPSALGLKIKAQYGEATLTKLPTTDEWLLAGYVST
jgi:hypothetical protein